MEEQIGLLHRTEKSGGLHENILLQDSVRISTLSMTQSLYPDLVMTVAVGGSKDRSQEYLEAFTNGNAKWFHLPQKTFFQKYKHHVVNEIRFLALATTSSDNPSVKEINNYDPFEYLTVVGERSDLGADW